MARLSEVDVCVWMAWEGKARSAAENYQRSIDMALKAFLRLSNHLLGLARGVDMGLNLRSGIVPLTQRMAICMFGLGMCFT